MRKTEEQMEIHLVIVSSRVSDVLEFFKHSNISHTRLNKYYKKHLSKGPHLLRNERVTSKQFSFWGTDWFCQDMFLNQQLLLIIHGKTAGDCMMHMAQVRSLKLRSHKTLSMQNFFGCCSLFKYFNSTHNKYSNKYCKFALLIQLQGHAMIYRSSFGLTWYEFAGQSAPNLNFVMQQNGQQLRMRIIGSQWNEKSSVTSPSGSDVIPALLALNN